MRLDIAYRLHFTYAETVSESQNEIRVRPRDDLRQRVLSYRLTTTPATRVLQTRDYFGTTVDHLGVRGPHDDLLVVAEASVETMPAPSAPPPVSCERLGDQQFANQHIEYLAPSLHVQWGDLIGEITDWAVNSVDDDVSERVLAIAKAVPTVLTYERGSTSIGVTLEGTGRRRSGGVPGLRPPRRRNAEVHRHPGAICLGLPVRGGRDSSGRRRGA